MTAPALQGAREMLCSHHIALSCPMPPLCPPCKEVIIFPSGRGAPLPCSTAHRQVWARRSWQMSAALPVWARGTSLMCHGSRIRRR